MPNNYTFFSSFMFPSPFLLICPSPCGISLSGHAQQFIFIRYCVRVASLEEPCVLNFHFAGFPALFFFFLKESPPHLLFRDQVGSTCPRSRSKQLELLLQRERRVILALGTRPVLGAKAHFGFGQISANRPKNVFGCRLFEANNRNRNR